MLIRDLKKITVASAIATLIGCSSTGIVPGTYGSTAQGSVVELRDDQTFTYTVSGGCFGEESTTGTYEFESSSVLRVLSDVRELPAVQNDSRLPSSTVFVTTVAWNSDPLPGVTLTAICSGQSRRAVTDIEGTAEFDTCSIEKLVAELDGACEPRTISSFPPGLNDITVPLLFQTFEVDERWRIRGKRLDVGYGVTLVRTGSPARSN